MCPVASGASRNTADGNPIPVPVGRHGWPSRFSPSGRTTFVTGKAKAATWRFGPHPVGVGRVRVEPADAAHPRGGTR